MDLLDLGWREAYAGVEAAVFVPVHPLEGRDLDVVEVAPWSLPADQFGLVQPDLGCGEALSYASPTLPTDGAAP